ncbi:LacI family DNA-binding transcriptional regulator [Deinococcus altitudinis]|uniref:LacI family DNA-binding transcriptional regulator n=1 Tax=Deinococcus altitudinis TaxID=468914 RepID=UPI0038911B0C
MVRASPPPSDPATPAQPEVSPPAGPPRRVTLKDIARALKVSPATVSNAYNRPDQLSPQLRARILETALALGYSGPDPLASSLRRGRAGAVGVVYDATLSYAFADPAASLFLGGLARALEEQSLGLLLIPSPQRPGNQESGLQGGGLQRDPQRNVLQGAVQPATGRVQSASVDGFVVYSASDGSELLKAVLGRGLPVVLVDQSQVDGVAYIGIDDAGGARAAARHLLDLGHRQIGVLSLEFGPLGPGEQAGPARGTEQPRGTVTPEREAQLSYHTTAERLRAYRGAATEAGAALFVMEAQDNTPQEAETLALELLRSTPGVTALLCMSDVLAQGALSAARKLGLEVPGSLSVVGFDDVPSSAALGLSSVHQPTAQKGELAGRALLELLAGGAARELILPTQLMVRGSSGPVREKGPGLQ